LSVVLVCKLFYINILQRLTRTISAITASGDTTLACGSWDKATILQYKSNFFWSIHQIFSNFSTPNKNMKRVAKYPLATPIH
jgi:hypothetical protein